MIVKKMRVIKCIALCLMAVFLLAGQAQAREMVLVTLESPPLEFEQNGKATGVNVDIAVEGLRRLGHTVDVRIVPWRRALRMVKTGVADAVIDVGWNEKRAQYIIYPKEPMYKEEIYGFTLQNSTVSFDNALLEANKYSVGVGRGFFYGSFVTQLLANGTFKDVQDVTGMEENINKVYSGRIDLFLGVRVAFDAMLKKMQLRSQFKLVPSQDTGEPYLLGTSSTYLGFSRAAQHEQLAEQFSAILRIMKDDGTIDAIYARYGLTP